MRKLLVKIFNLVYLAGAAVSIWALVTRPVINTEVGINLTSDQVADKLVEIFKNSSGGGEGGSGGGSSASSYKLAYREESSSSEVQITKEDIKKAFPNGFSLSVGIKIEAKDAFDFKNKELLKKSVAQSIENSLNNVVGKVTTSLKNLITQVTQKIAVAELTKQIDEQISQYFEGASPVTEKEVEAVYNNVVNTINQEGDVTVDMLATAIVGVKDETTGEYPEGTLLYLLEEKKKETGTGLIYAVADPQPTSQDDIDEGIYFVPVVDDPETEEEEKGYVAATTYLLESTYYVEKYDATDVSAEDIVDKLAESLDSIPGLVEEKQNQPVTVSQEEFNKTVKSTVHYYSPEGVVAKTFVLGGVYDDGEVYYTITDPMEQPMDSVVEAELEEAAANRHFVIKTEEGFAFPEDVVVGGHYYYKEAVSVTKAEYYETAGSTKYKVKITEPTESYVYAKEYSSTDEYFMDTKIVNSVDDALSKLIEQMLGGGGSSESGESGEPSKAKFRAEGDSQKSTQEELEAAIKEYLYKLLPLDTIYGFTETADQYSTYVVLGLIGLMVFPWALFALVTLIRTLRREKCWTKPWIVFVFAFLQVIFGIVLTYGTKYAMPLISKYIPQVGTILEDTGLALMIKTGCLIPSFIYCGMIPFTIVYIIFAHRLKVDYKLKKRNAAIERYKARREQ